MAKRSRSKERAGKGIAKVAAAQREPSRFSRDWLWGLILVLAVFLAYLPVLHAGFIWDDDMHLTANPVIIGPLGLKEIWTTSAAQFFPLVLTTFWIEHALWGLAPWPYHLVNVLLHGACAVVLWRVLRRLQVPGAWLGAALWALHPVQVESVAWITEMKNTESGLFYLLSMLFFVRWLKAGDNDGRTVGGGNYGLTLLFAALAIASKSSTVILPVVLCLCAWWTESRWSWRIVVRLAPIFLLSLFSAALTIWTVKLQEVHDDPQWARTWPERLAGAGDVVWFYLGKLLWPHPLITVYPRWQIDAGQWFSYLPLLAVVIVLLLFWLKRGAWGRPWFFAFAYFLVALLPVLGLLDIYTLRYSLVFDHYQYLAGMGPLALAGAGMVHWADRIIPGRSWLQSRLGAGLLLVLLILSWNRAWVYESSERLWTDTLAKNPESWMAHNNLGLALLEKGQVDEAMAEFQKTSEINPNYNLAYYNLGLALFQKGEANEAMVQYRKALEIDPRFAPAYNNLGNSLLFLVQLDSAMVQYRKALAIDPNSADAHNNLGFALAQKGEMDEAMIEYRKALAIDPNLARAHNNLGFALAQKGEVDEALVEFRKALAIDPFYISARTNLGNALLQKGRLDEALAQFQEVVRLNPHDGNAQNNLARAEALMRQRVSPK